MDSFLRSIKGREEALKGIEETLAATSIDEAGRVRARKRYLKEGFESLKKKNYKEALGAFSIVIGFSPRCKEAWYGRGVAILHMEGDVKEGFDSIHKALEIDPGYKDALDFLSHSF